MKFGVDKIVVIILIITFIIVAIAINALPGWLVCIVFLICIGDDIVKIIKEHRIKKDKDE